MIPMIRPLLAGALLFALPTMASAQEEMKTRNMGAVYAGMGTVQLGGSAMWGPELGLSYRSEMGFFAFEAEPVSVLLDDFGERTGLRVGFLSPGVRFMFLENRQVSPSVGASIGFNYTGPRSGGVVDAEQVDGYRSCARVL